MNMKLTSENVNLVLKDCLGREEDPAVEGVNLKLHLKQDKVEQHKKDIEDMLSCLPDNFLKSKGGGWTFLNMCNDKNGEQWTSLHHTVDVLVCLGIASGLVSFLLPREMWGIFPGGMPYVTVNL